MLDDSKKTLVVPLDGIVEGCLDYLENSNSYALRIEGMDSRIVIIPEGSGFGPFMAVFERFVKEVNQLQEVTPNT